MLKTQRSAMSLLSHMTMLFNSNGVQRWQETERDAGLVIGSTYEVLLDKSYMTEVTTPERQAQHGRKEREHERGRERQASPL